MEKYKLVCTIRFSKILIQIIIWAVLILVSFGLATPFFLYYMIKLLINHTEVHSVEKIAERIIIKEE